MKTFTLIEAFSHAECIYSQVLCIKEAGHKVHFIGNKNLRDRIESFGFESCTFFSAEELKQLRTLIKIRKTIISNHTDYVVFNTAQGNLVRSICLLPFSKKIEFLGLMHNVKKLKSSFSQKLISRRVKKYYVLNDYIENSQQPKLPGLQLKSFYPIFFTSFDEKELKKPDNEIWITIPGSLESSRKDYDGFLSLIENDMAIPNNIKFILLGRCLDIDGRGLEIKNWVRNNNMEHRVKLFYSFINDDLFHSYIKKSDFIMPCLHPQQKNYQDFLETKVSGSFNLAFAYKKPLLCYEDFKAFEDFKENAVFYNFSNFNTVLENISYKNNSLLTNLYNNNKWSFKSQQFRYLELCQP